MMFRLIKKYVLFNLSAGMEYKVSFLMQVFGMALNNSAFIFFWLILFDRVGNINGYGFQEVMFLWALVAAGYGMAEVFLGNGRSISSIIYKGELDVYLLQPRAVIPNLLCSRMNTAGWGDLLYGLILFFFSQPLGIAHIGLFLLFSVAAAVLFGAVNILFHSLTFYLGNAERLAGMGYELLISFMLYPGTVFQGPVLWVLHSLIPAALVAWIPAEIFYRFSAGKMLLLLGADALFILISWFSFHQGLKKYASGNQMGTRI